MKVEAKIVIENAGPVARSGGVPNGKFGEVLDRVVGETGAVEAVVAEEGECAEELPGEACVPDASIVSAAEPSEVVPVMVPELVASAIDVVRAPVPVEASVPEVSAEVEPAEGSIASSPATVELAQASTETLAKNAEPHAAANAAREREVVSAAAKASPPDRVQTQQTKNSPATPHDRSPIDVPASVDTEAPAPTRTSLSSRAAPTSHDARIAAPSSEAPPREPDSSTHTPEEAPVPAVPTDPGTPSSTTPSTPSTPTPVDATPTPAVGLEPIAAPAPGESTPSTIDPTLPTTTPTAESPDPTPLAEEPTATPRTSDPEIADRIEKVRTALEKLRPIPDGGVTVDVDLDGIGRVELRVEPVDGGMRVSLGTDEPTALARLEAQRSELESALRHNGETLSLDIHTNGRRARTPRPPVPSRDGDHAPSRTDTASPRRSGRGLVDIVA